MEAICNQLRGEMDDVMRKAYEQAVADKDEEVGAVGEVLVEDEDSTDTSEYKKSRVEGVTLYPVFL